LSHRPPLRRQDREASFKVSAKALVLNGRTLPWQAPGGALGMVSLGSRIADQQVNGSVEWLNGANFHVERRSGPGPLRQLRVQRGGPIGPAARLTWPGRGRLSVGPITCLIHPGTRRGPKLRAAPA
jgi:hypothetical protein